MGGPITDLSSLLISLIIHTLVVTEVDIRNLLRLRIALMPSNFLSITGQPLELGPESEYRG